MCKCIDLNPPLHTPLEAAQPREKLSNEENRLLEIIEYTLMEKYITTKLVILIVFRPAEKVLLGLTIKKNVC